MTSIDINSNVFAVFYRFADIMPWIQPFKATFNTASCVAPLTVTVASMCPQNNFFLKFVKETGNAETVLLFLNQRS